MCHRFAVATVPGGVAGYGEPGAGLGGPPVGAPGRTAGSRLGWAVLLLAVAAGAGGLTYAIGRESGLAAVTGRRAVARTSHCRGARERICDAEIIGLDGRLIDAGATLSGFTRVDSDADVHVRYRAGRAAPDTLPERSAQAGMMLFLAGVAGAALFGAGAAVAGREGHVVVAAAAVPTAALPVFAVSLIATLFAGAPTLGAGRVPVPDIYARVAAEPGRTLNAQGVQFLIVDNQPMSRAGCFGAPGCVVGAVAHWTVTGTDLVATSHLLVFDGAQL